jgi:hypothetical protein
MSKNDKKYFYKNLAMSNDINTGEGVIHFPPGGNKKGGKNLKRQQYHTHN